MDELQTSLITLKSMIETLEGKIKNVDPNQYLELQKKQLETDANLRRRAGSTQESRGAGPQGHTRSRAGAQKGLIGKLQSDIDDLKTSASGEAVRKLQASKKPTLK